MSQTAAVQLREVQDDDLPILYSHQLDPIANQMAAFPAREEAAFMAHWDKIRANPSNMIRTILFDGQVVGSISSFVMEGQREVGYWIGREHWGKGIATQALAAFLQVDTTRPLHAHAAKHNLGSIRVLEKCGFKAVGEDSYANPAGEVVEEVVLKID